MTKPLVVIKGAGDLASGVGHRLVKCGFAVAMLEISLPTVIRRSVSFAEAVYQGLATVEGVTARLAPKTGDVVGILRGGDIALLVDPGWDSLKDLAPDAVVDAVMAKRNLGTDLTEAPVVIGLGPGFTAGKDVHAVVETMRGHDLGKVIYQGQALPDTGVPGEIGGYAKERLVRAPVAGIFSGKRQIGDMVQSGEIIAAVEGTPVVAAIPGILRGILHDGLKVSPGFKIGDIDPRCSRENCFTISDKARSVAGGVVEALLNLTNGVKVSG